MPRRAADLDEALKKKGGLTLSQLANYDDILTDALVDRVYFWSTIRKLKATYHPCRGVLEADICNILQTHIVIGKDVPAAHEKVLQLPGIQRFYRSLKTDDEREHFERHLRKYLSIYLPDCSFEVCTTNRYTIMTAEASIVARRTIRKGEPIKYLSGIQVEMSEKEEEELSSRTDFSIVLSSRRKRPSLFLGPARFANHDCDSNARLNTSGPHGIHIVACKDIAPGDEITVKYGIDYFGEDNCECLCATCESLRRNGWDPKGVPTKDEEEAEDSNMEESELIRKRKRGANEDATMENEPRKRIHGDKASNATRTLRDTMIDKIDANLNEARLRTRASHSRPSSVRADPSRRSTEREQRNCSGPPDRTKSSLRTVTSATDELDVYSVPPSPPPEGPPGNGRGRTSVPAGRRSRIETSGSSASPSPNGTESSGRESSSSSATSIDVFAASGAALSSLCEALKGNSSNVKLSQDFVATPPQLLSPAKSEARQRRSHRLSPQHHRHAPSPSALIRSIEPVATDDIDSCSENPVEARVPGDYHLCRALLTTADHRWVECRNCDEWFVQSDAYQTRIACPRCERHSKLHGFHWPKTEPEGKFDRDVRVLDHRTIHRFIDPEDERVEKKGRHSLHRARERHRESSSQLQQQLDLSSHRLDSEGPSPLDAARRGPRGRVLRQSPRRQSDGGRRPRSGAPRVTM